MLTESLQSIATATRRLLRNWSVMVLFVVIYASLIAALYLFVTIREASTGQVVLSLALTITAPVLFFLLQTASATQTHSTGAWGTLREAIRGSWKVIAVSVPLVALAVLLMYLLGKAQAYMGTDGQQISDIAAQYQPGMNKDARPAVRWSQVSLSAIRYLSLGLVLPLIAIHFWNASVGSDLRATIRNAKELIAGAFAPSSVLIYMTGFVVFGVVPYLLLFKLTTASGAWTEITLFVARLVLVFVLTLFGWVITMSALAIYSSSSLGARASRPPQAN